MGEGSDGRDRPRTEPGGGYTELGGGKLKKGKGFLKPNFELGPSL